MASVLAVALASFVVPTVAQPSTAQALATACGSGGTPAVLALQDPNFYVDTSLTPSLDSTYAGYTVQAGSSSLIGTRLQLSNFTGGVVGLAAGQAPSTVLPDIPAGTSASAYFMLTASGLTTSAQTHTVSLYQGATLVCQRTFTFNRVHDTIKALANKVLTITIDVPTATVGIGDVVDVVVTGKTGTLGAGPSWDPGVLSYSPTSLSGFPAGSWRLEKTVMQISPNGVAPQSTYVNRLYLSGASGPDRPYTAVYTYRAIAPAAASGAVQPVQYIASGTQVKHTDPSGSASASLPAISNVANLAVAKAVNISTFNPVGGVTTGGRVTYTVTVTNSGSAVGSLDSLVDTLPTGTTFVSGSATIAGRAATPTLSSGTLTFYGPILVPAAGSTVITYQVDVPSVAGSYVNSAVGYLATSTIDGSTDVTASNPATATVVVKAATVPVVAVDDSTSTNAATAVTIPVTANDTGSGLTVTIITQPANGTVSVSGTSVIYTPNVGFGGTDTFEYQITDGSTSDIATVSVSVPLARNDSYALPASSTINVTAANGLLANDFCSASPCTVAVLTSPSAGMLTLSSDGSFSYTSTNTAGILTFTYRLTDANGKTSDATVTITVSNFGPDRITTPYQTAVTITVTANDTCLGTCNPQVTATPTNGTAVRNADETITYTPNDGFWGVDTFTYSKGGSGTTALVTVMTAPPTATFTTPYGTAVTSNPTTVGYVTGLTTIACTSCTFALGTAPTKGTVSINPSTGAFTYTPSEGSAGSDSFTYTVTEPGGLSVTGTVNITIGPEAVDDSTSVLASTASVTRQVTINVLTNDACPGTCTVTVQTAPTSGTLTQTPGTGTFTYSNKDVIGDVTFVYKIVSSLAPTEFDTAIVTIRVEGAADDTATTQPGVPVSIPVTDNDPCEGCTVSLVATPTVGTATITGSSIEYAPPAGFAGVVTFSYTVTKGGGTTTAMIMVTVSPIANDDLYSVVNGVQYVLTLLEDDICADCRITLTDTPTDGLVEIGTTGLIVRYTAPASGTGPYTFNYTITDSTGLTDSALVTLVPEVAPTAVDDSATVVTGNSVEIDVDTNDTCPSTCTIAVASDPSNGTVSVSVMGSIYYTPAPGFTGRDTFTYTTTSTNGLSATATVTVDVTPIATDDSYTMSPNETRTLSITTNDICSGCTLELDPPTGGTILGSTSTTVEYQAPATAGTYTFTYRVVEADTDPDSWASATVTILVSDAFPDAVATPHETSVVIPVISNDPCASLSPSCTVQSVGTPSSGTTTNTDTTITYTPALGFVGLATFTYTAANGSMSATTTVTVLVGPPPRTATTQKNTPLSGDLLAGATCPGCEISLVSFPGSGELTLGSDGTWTYTPATDFTGTEETITYRITDPVTGLTRDGTLVITVEATVPSVSVSKTAGSIVDTDSPTNGVGDAGDTVTYTYVITNTGGATLTSVTLTDDKIAASGIDCDGDNVVASLAVGADTTCTATYTLAQADVNSGSVTNTATVSASASGGPYTATDDATVNITRAASMTVAKTAGSMVDTDTPSNGAKDVGDTVEYTYVITNTGNVTLTAVTLTDDKIASSGISCDGDNVVATLAPGADTTCTATYTMTQADVDAGSVTNTASVSAAAPDGVTAPSTATDDATVSITRSASVTVAKTAGSIVDTDTPSNGAKDVGDTVEYTYVVTNTGNVTLTAVTLTDDKIVSSGIDCDGDNVVATLAPGATATCTATYTLTQDDVDAGSVTNTATVSAVAPEGATDPTDATDDATVEITRSASMTVAKTAGSIVDTDSPANAAGDVGDTVEYTYVITNTGNVTLSSITLTDDKIASSGIVCDTDNVVASLAPGADTTCTATYTLTQADVDAGSVTNTATVSATAPVGATAPTDATDDATVTITQSASMTVVKSAGSIIDADVPSNGTPDVGDTVTYSYVITNTGNVSLSSVTLSDDKISSIDIECDTDNIVASLAPGADTTCTATYTLTQADVDAGSVTNTATVSASAPAGVTAPTDATDDATVEITRSASMTVAKTAGSIVDTDSPSNAAGDVGDTVEYTYVITNTGNVTLSSITLTDDKIASSGIVCDTDNLVASLAPGADSTCTATYTLTQADVDAGSVTNTATVSASAPAGVTDPSDATDDATVEITRSASMTVAKTAGSIVDTDSPANAAGDVGDTVEYTYVITNTGNVTLTSITLTDDKIASSGIDCDGDNVVASLAPGATATCTATYTLTQADVDAGSVTNTATVTAVAPEGATDPTDATDDATVEITRSASMTVAKSAGSVVDTDTPANGAQDVGDTVEYTYVITNTGNATLSSVTLTDDKIASADLDCGDGSNAAATLVPGATATCTATYTLTQADVDAGSVTNTATVTAAAPAGATDPTDATDDATVEITRSASMTVAKSAGSVVDTDTPANAAGDVGDTVEYTYVITNTGNVTLTSVTLTDDKIASSAISCDGDNVVATLAPGATATCTATYTLTQTDVDAGSVTNTATVSASAPAGATAPTDATDDATVNIAQTASMTVAKSAGSIVDADVPSNGTPDVGDTITYSYVITNTGNVELSAVTLTDDKIASSDIECNTDNIVGSLAPGADTTCTATYTLTQADVDAGSVTNTATVSATAPEGATDPADATDDATVTITRSASMTVAKTAGSIVDMDSPANAAGDVGDTVEYTYVITNTGNVTLTSITLTDDKIGSTDVICDTDNLVATLAPGAEVTCTAAYTLAQTDVDAGSVTNTATVIAAAPEGATDPTDATDDATVEITRSASMTVSKSAGSIVDTDSPMNAAGDVGDTVEYTYVITNTGNVTLTSVTLTDDKIVSSGIDCDGDNVVETLAPGADVTCTATYTLTQADVDAGSVTNTATVSASAPAGATDPTDATDVVTVEITQSASMTVAKSAGPVVDADVPSNGTPDVGDTITYSYVIANTGNVTLTSVTLTDDKIASADIECDTDNVVATLAPGADVTCTATYTLIQDDVDAGSVTNTATVSATAPAGVTDPTDATDDATVNITRSVSMTVSKTAGSIVDTDTPANGAKDVGDTVEYTYVITNTGNVTLTSITLTDDKIVSSGIDCDGDNVVSSLAPGATATCTATYTLPQDDVDAGSVTNTATVSATAPEGATDPTDATDDATVEITRSASMTVGKSAGSIVDTDSPMNAAGDVGDTVEYTYVITNTGNVTLTSVTLTDDKIASSGIDCDGDNVVSSLAPGATVTCTATYTLPQDDVDAGSVTNTASVSASAPAGATDPTDATDDATVEITRSASMTVSKTAGSIVDTDTPANGAKDVGDTVEYTYVITNTGNVTLTSITLTDDKIVSSGIDCDGDNVVSSLAPGATVTCTATYTLTQADVDAGSVTNTASVSASAPAGATDPTDATDDATVEIARVVAFTLDKAAGSITDADTPSNGTSDVGDTITYTLTVTNTGNVTLTGVTVVDDLVGTVDCGSGSATVASLAPGESVDCSGTYALTQGDVDAGEVVNEASVDASGPSGTADPEPVTDTAIVEVPADPSVAFEKSAGPVVDGDSPANGIPDAGDTITYSYVVTNTGNVTLSSVTVTDDKIADLDIDCDGDNVVATLAPESDVTCTATYVLTQDDIDNGGVTNIAVVEATAPGGSAGGVTNTDSVEVGLARSANLGVTKSGSHDNSVIAPSSRTDAGDVVVYTYTVSNTGNVTLTEVTLTDDKIAATDIDCDGDNVIASLAPGESVECTANYVVGQDDLDLGSVTNIATVDAVDPEGAPVTLDSDPVTVDFVASPSMTVAKTAGPVTDTDTPVNGVSDTDDTITYTYRVTNTGNVTLTDLTLTDDRIAATDIDCDGDNVIGTLPPGEWVDCTATYVLTQDDIDARSVTNVAEITASAPDGVEPPATATDEVTVELSPTVFAVDDFVEIPQGAIAEVTVLLNDLGSEIQVVAVGVPSAGTVTFDGTRVIVTPPLNFVGDITVTYQISDGVRFSTATVTVRITPNPSPPMVGLFFDLDADGIHDDAEPGVAGVTMDFTLVARSRITSAGTVLGADGPPLGLFRCTTGSDGRCLATGMPVGVYWVTAVYDVGAAGMRVTADPDVDLDLLTRIVTLGGVPLAPTPASSSAAEGGGGVTPMTVTDGLYEFGVHGTGVLQGQTYLERNGTGGYQGATDPSLAGQRLLVRWAGPDGIFGTGDDLEFTAEADASGRYRIEGLPTGQYEVVLDPTDLPPGSFTTGPIMVSLAPGVVATADLPRVDPDMILPETGGAQASALRWAMILLLGGAAIVVLSRRRRPGVGSRPAHLD